MEELKEALRRLLREDREFLRDLILGAISGDGSVAEEIMKLILNNPKTKAELLSEIAGGITIPLNVATKDDIKQLEGKMATKDDIRRLEERMATKDDLKQFATKEDLMREVRRLEEKMATKEDLKRLEERMATREQIENITRTVEEEARETVKWLLQQRGVKCEPQRLFLDGDYEFDVYCVADSLTVVGEAKVRAGPNIVDRLVARVDEAARRWPDKFRGKVVKVLYCLVAHPTAVDRAKELGVWLIESLKEKTSVEL
ncbi:MAG: hypothetical protein QXK63_02905 [Thermoproteus sp.]